MPNPALLQYLDGSYSGAPTDCALPRLEYREDHPGLAVWHRTMECLAANYDYPVRGALLDVYGFHLRDSEWEDMGGTVVRFQRYQHSMPPDRTEPWAGTKNIQDVYYTLNGSVTTDIQIITSSMDVGGTVAHHYAMGDPGAISVKPFVIILIIGSQKIITDNGSGFPKNGGGYYTSNKANSVISSTKERVIGNLWVRKTISGGASF